MKEIIKNIRASSNPSKMLMLGLLLPLLGLASCTGCRDADVIRITGMEITQGIQTATHTVPLVANRSTAVRVFLCADTTEAIGPVTGVLTVTVDGSEITPPGGLPQILPAYAQPNPSRDIEDHTLNFELPAPTGITSSSNVSFAVTISYANDTDESNNIFRVDSLSVTELDNPVLLFTRIDYTPSGSGPPALSIVEAGAGEAMVKGVFPVVDSDSALYGPAPSLDISFSEDYNGNGLIDPGAESAALFSTLAAIRDLQVNQSLSPLSYTFIYGWLNGSPMNGFGGAGQLGEFSAYGNTTLTQYQRSYANELGHNFGLRHNYRTVCPEAGWDTGTRLENNPVGNNTAGRVKPGEFVDIMNSGPPTNGTWVDGESYTFFYDRMLSETALPLTAVSRQTSVTSGISKKAAIDAAGVLIVHGYFNAAGTELSRLYPALRLTNPAKLPRKRESGIFTAVVTGDDGEQHSFPFDAMVCYEGLNALQHGFFELLIPMSPSQKVRKLEILKTETRQRMGGWNVSRPPSVKILAPDQRSQLGAQTTVRWKADDADTDPKDMRFHLQYSPDGGSNWAAIGVNLSGNSFTFKSKEILRANDKLGILKIYACDGLNTATDQIEGLTTATANK